MMTTIDRDVTCLTCQYNLRGLDPASRCPECGRSVRESLAVHDAGGTTLLEHANPLWRLCVAGGLILLTSSLVLMYLPAKWPIETRPGFLITFTQYLPIISVIGIVLTVWPRAGERSIALLALRVLILLAALGSLLYLERLFSASTPATRQLIARLSNGSALAGTVLLFVYLVRLARRIPSRSYVLQAIGILVLIALSLLGELRLPRQLPITPFFLLPSLVGIGSPSHPPEFVTLLLGVFYFRWPSLYGANIPQMLAGIAAIWAAGYHASLAYTLLRLRR